MKARNSHTATVILTVILLMPSARLTAQALPAPVQIAEASEKAMTSVILAPGTVVSRNDARIAAEISGRLTWVAEIGAHVEQGAILARIDDRALQLELKDNQATIKRLRANLDYVRRQLDRLQRLANENNAAKDQLDEVRSQKEMAEQELAQAEIARDQTLYDIERSKVVAPFSGRIVQRAHQAGEYIALGEEIARLVDTQNIEVRAQAPMSVARYLHDGAEVVVKDKEQLTRNRIRTVIPVGDDRSRMIEVRVSLEDFSWVIGAAVRVELPASAPTSAVTVPRDALILRQDSTYLFKVADDNTVQQISVQTGIGSGEYIEVRGEIADGDRVVTRGGERLSAGQQVTVVTDS